MDINSRRGPADPLNASAGITQLAGLLAVVCLAWTARAALRLSELYPLKAGALFAIVGVFTLVLLHDNHPFARYGPANQITTLRAVLVALVAGLIGEPRLPVVGVWAVGLSVIVAMLDGIDGWLARRSRMASDFGARFDMEVDAALIMALAILAWRHDKAGAWVVLSGLLRYLFVAAGWWWQWLQRPLPPVRRRQAICVVQILVLIVVMMPAVTPPISTVLSVVALGALCYSFLIDILWLWRQHRIDRTGDEAIEGGRHRGQRRHEWRRSIGLAAAVVFLDVAVTFSNIWPTPAIRWQGELSVELASFILLLVIATRWLGPPSRAALGWLSVLWVLLVIGRYVDVTAPALYGRDINLYWDLRYVPDVVSMLVRVAPVWLGFLVAASAVLLLYVMFVLVRSAMRRLGTAMLDARERRLLGALAAVVIMLFAGEQLTDRLPVAFGNPVLTTFARQVPLVIGAVAGSASLDPSPPMDSDLALVKGADVLLVFLESYGAVSYDQPEFNRLLTPSRGQLEAAIRATGRDVVSTFVEIADLWWQFLAGPSEPAVRRRGPRSEHQCRLDDAEAGHAGHGVQPSGLPHGRPHARIVATMAGRRLLRIRRYLWRRETRLSRPAVWVVEHVGSIRLCESGCSRGEPGAARATVPLLPHHQHPHAIHPHSTVSARLAPDVGGQAL